MESFNRWKVFFLHMRCVVHILNLVGRDGQRDHELTIENIHNAVRFVRSSPQRGLKFKECKNCKDNM